MAASINLILQYCTNPDPQRQNEYDFCVQQNLANPHIASVWNLSEKVIPIPDVIRNHPKYHELTIGHWLTYATAFDFANSHFERNAIVCLCNLDIFLDRGADWEGAARMLIGTEPLFLCCSRHEFDGVSNAHLDETLLRAGMANSQDAWLFCTPVNVADVDFEIGMPGCDNAIAHRVKRSGYLPYNDPHRFRIMHYDLCCRESGEGRWRHQKRVVPHRHPEQEGQFLVPAVKMVESLDTLADQLDLSPLRRYEIAAEIVSRFVKIKSSTG